MSWRARKAKSSLHLRDLVASSRAQGPIRRLPSPLRLGQTPPVKKAVVQEIERQLNPEQVAAVTHGEGPQLVLAGAGSGKTRVITYRIYWLLEEMGVDPGHIAAMTFTNTAAGEMRERIRRRTRFLLVDEYQDTNHAQLRLVQELNGPGGNLTAVGDEDQGIYRWRGADLNNILEFEKTFANSVVRKLERNYRSTQTILAVSGALIAHNVNRRGT